MAQEKIEYLVIKLENEEKITAVGLNFKSASGGVDNCFKLELQADILLKGRRAYANTSKFQEIYFEITEGKLAAVIVNGTERIPVQAAVAAIGHSARDTFEMLQKRGVYMEPKSFAVGLRIEHPQEMINMDLYGEEENEALGAASYKVTHTCENGRGVYSFCMCPGGYVVNASSEEGYLAVNGMSYHARDSHNANSAIVVTVTPEDFESDHPLAGIAFQRKLEKAAYKAGT